jgi:G3E family GTPase
MFAGAKRTTSLDDGAMTRAHVITGSFGAGKTTAIRWLMAHKPVAELWVVILNEFTDAGIDALSVAESSLGAYDVRLVAGGCLCCVGELEFAKQLRDILRNFKPACILIEPSGAGHAADIVDVLSVYEAQGALSLHSVICLVDPVDAARILKAHEGNEWSQIQSADVLLLSKPDLAGETERRDFDAIVREQYPMKRMVGSCPFGELPPEALQRFERDPQYSLLTQPAPVSAPRSLPFALLNRQGSETQWQQLNLWAVQWLLPRELTFSRVILEARLRFMVEAYGGYLRRMKGVFKVGPGPSWLVQSATHGLAAEDSAHRRDSRIELVLSAAPTAEFVEAWRALLRDAVNPGPETSRSS